MQDKGYKSVVPTLRPEDQSDELQPWIDPDQSQMPGMFGESTAAISAEQLRMVNATAALSPEHLGRDLLAMRAEPEEAAQSDSTRVGGADLGGMFGAEPLPSASASRRNASPASSAAAGLTGRS